MTIAHPAPRSTTTNTRELRALALYRERHHEIERIGEDLYLVPSCTGERTYRVDYAAETCNCPAATPSSAANTPLR